MQPPRPYPVQFSVEYPDRPLDRLSSIFRIIAAVPIFIVGVFVFGGIDANDYNYLFPGGVLFLAPLLLILFRGKYPRWWFDWNVGVLKFGNRILAYVLLLRDEYPSTDEEQAVRTDVAYPDVETDLNKFLPIVKWLLAIPHYVVLVFLSIAVVVVAVIAWFAILATGRYPRALFDFVEGVIRWGTRVECYMFLLTTDRYPPFSLRE